ncbi:UNVERIFIED_CONTAM: mdh, partial [Trichonephila clavipes]
MTYLALKSSGLPKNRIIGMGGALDSARFKYQISDKLNASANDLNAIVIGGHGDTTMIPLIKHATWNSIAVSSFLTEEEEAEIVKKTMVGEGFAEGKAQDMMQTSALLGFDSKITGVTNDYLATAGSTVAVITSGIPRKPGMTREELIGTNANIVKTVVENLIQHSPDIIILI